MGTTPNPTPLYAEERHRLILERARANGRVDVGALAAEFDVTPETIRRDLTSLERHGLVRRVHGGAIPVERLGFEPGLHARDAAMAAEKERIARAALAELPAEGAILLDAGTTTARLAEILPSDRELTVVTNAVPIAMTLSGRPNITVLTVGGRVRGRTLAMVDQWAVRVLAETFTDVGFVATNGVSVERGLTTPDVAEAAVKRAMLGAARRVVVLADHTKVGNDHFACFGDLDQVDTLVTDSGLDPSLASDLEAAGPRVVLA
jgi:DeoR family fructose operon transcriptional repressor